jgi:hypothetical protein
VLQSRAVKNTNRKIRNANSKADTSPTHKLQKWEAVGLAALTALGVGIGKGAMEAIQSEHQEPRIQEIFHPSDQNKIHPWQNSPQENLPTGGEPKQLFHFTLVDKQGNEHAWSSQASVRNLVTDMLPKFDWPENVVLAEDFHEKDVIAVDFRTSPTSPIMKADLSKRHILQAMWLDNAPRNANDLDSVQSISIVQHKDEKSSI